MSGEKVRFGLVGCGRVGTTAESKVAAWAIADWWRPFTHAAGIAAVEDAELVAVCDVDETAARLAMREHRARACYTDHREMLARETLDAVAIATRTAERTDVIEDAVSRGVKGIYCEKPLSNTLEDADRVADLLEGRGVFFVYGTRRRYMPAYRQVREAAMAGAIGDLTTIVVRFGYSLLFWGHPHSVDIAAFFAGDVAVRSVQADLDLDAAVVDGAVIDADPMVRMAYMTFANGVAAHIVAGESFDVDLFGRKGMLSVRSDGSAVRARRRSSPADDGWLLAEEPVEIGDQTSGTVASFRALTAAVRHGKDPEYGARRAAQNQEVLFGFVESHLRGGARVELPLERRKLRITGRSGAFFA